MTEVRTDTRGRVTVPKQLRERFGDRYRLVELDDGIKLVPIPDDPIERLRDAAGEELSDASPDELRDAADERGRDEALDDLARDR
jgi:bifunctional DNA-binding transcriptional regulator/antitoxin component of YhaV-PrlF toxin-antitoxin module